MGTAKLLVVAFDSKTRHPVMNSGYTLARTDFQNWTVLAAGGVQSGSVETDLVSATGERSSTIGSARSSPLRRFGEVTRLSNGPAARSWPDFRHERHLRPASTPGRYFRRPRGGPYHHPHDRLHCFPRLAGPLLGTSRRGRSGWKREPPVS